MKSLKYTYITLLASLVSASLSLPVIAADDAMAMVLKRMEQMETRIKVLEAENAELNKSLNEPYISDSEPEISARLKALESQSNSYKGAVKIAQALDGIEVGGGLTMAAQGVSGVPNGSKDTNEVNYRGDVTVSLPAGDIGASEGLLFAHFRVGQGLGVENPGDAFSSFNSTSFQRPGTSTSDSTILLAQAWYQLTVPLPLGGNSDLSRQHIELNVGKIDPFMFFDQNNIADDETRGYMNQAFVHNPLLDVGGDIGVDDFGFTPGVRMAWINDTQKPLQYSVSAGIFGAGDGASFEGSLSDPFIIIEADTKQSFFTGLEGNYRVYYWRNGSTEDLHGNQQTHSGLGLSLEQKVGDYTTLFARYGHQTEGSVKFDNALTLGADFGGSYWNRGGDAIGVAAGWLSLSNEYKEIANYNTTSQEQMAEVFYRYRLNSQLDISPNLQYIRTPGGSKDASSMTAVGLRAQLNF
ncbi:MAG: carbohydrate porin [Pseudomonadota bacterium]